MLKSKVVIESEMRRVMVHIHQAMNNLKEESLSKISLVMHDKGNLSMSTSLQLSFIGVRSLFLVRWLYTDHRAWGRGVRLVGRG